MIRKIMLALMLMTGLIFTATNNQPKAHQALYDYLQKNQQELQWNALGVESLTEFDVIKVTCPLEKTQQLFEIAKKFNADKSLFEKLNEEEIVFSFYFKKESSPEKRQEALKELKAEDSCPPRVKVLLVKPEQADFIVYKHYQLSFEPRTTPVLSGEEGIVSEVLFKPGEEVKKGQILLVLNEGIEAEKEKLQADIKKLEKKIKAQKATKKDEEQYLQLTEVYKTKQHLKEYSLVSMVDGKVKNVLVSEGQKVAKGERLLMLGDYSELLATIELSEEDRQLWAENEQVVINFNQEELIATVASLSEKRLVIKLDNKQERLVVPFKIEIKKSWKKLTNVLLVDERSLRSEEDGRKYLFTVRAGKARKVYPQIAAIYNGKVAITSGINSGQKIIAEPDNCIQQGKKVKPIKSEKKEAEYRALPVKEETIPLKTQEELKMAAMAGIYFQKLHINDESFAEFYKKEKNIPAYALAFNFYQGADFTANLRFYSDENLTTSTEKPIKFKMSALSFGVRYRFLIKESKFEPYAQAGLNIFSYQEENPIEDFKDKATGFYLGGGVFYKLHRLIRLDLFMKYNFVKDKYDDPTLSISELNLGGFEIGLGLVMRIDF